MFKRVSGDSGQLALPEIGMYYYKARIYHPKLGRFLQTDPVGYEDQMNLYAYVGNDPVNMVDPSGERGMHVSEADVYAQALRYDNAKHANKDINNKVTKAMDAVTPSRNTVHNVASFTSTVFLIGALTPCLVACLEASTFIDAAIATDQAINGEFIKAGLTMLPGYLGGVAQKASKTIKEGIQLNVATTIVINDTITTGASTADNKNSDSGMSGAVWKVCSGMGAQKGGC